MSRHPRALELVPLGFLLSCTTTPAAPPLPKTTGNSTPNSGVVREDPSQSVGWPEALTPPTKMQAHVLASVTAASPQAFERDDHGAVNALMTSLLLQGPFDNGIACAALSPLPSEPTAFPIVVALLSNGVRAWELPNEEFVTAVVADLDRGHVLVGLPLFEALPENEWPVPDSEPVPPRAPPDGAEPRRIAGAWRIDLMEKLSFAPQPGRYRVWLLEHDWRSNACDVEVTGTRSPKAARAVAPLPSPRKVTFSPADPPPPPDGSGVNAVVRRRYLQATVRAETRTGHLPSEPTTVIEADSHEYQVAAVIPVTLVLTSGAGGESTVVDMGVPVYGPPPQVGEEIQGSLGIDLTALAPFHHENDARPGVLWLLVENRLHGPVKVE